MKIYLALYSRINGVSPVSKTDPSYRNTSLYFVSIRTVRSDGPLWQGALPRRFRKHDKPGLPDQIRWAFLGLKNLSPGRTPPTARTGLL